MSIKSHDEAITASTECGEVLLDGPDGLATSLTPEAARRSAKRIAEAAEIAMRYRDAEAH